MEKNVPAGYKCDILVDQDRYIGGDPVGYACSGDAVREDKDGVLWCARCLSILMAHGAHRLTVPTEQPFGRAAQDRAAAQALADLKGGE